MRKDFLKIPGMEREAGFSPESLFKRSVCAFSLILPGRPYADLCIDFISEDLKGFFPVSPAILSLWKR